MLQMELNLTRQNGRSNLQNDPGSVDAVTPLQVAVNEVHVEEACAQLLKTPRNVSPKRFRVNSHPEEGQKDFDNNSQISLPNQPQVGSLGKRYFKIPTIINGSIIMDASDTFQQNHGRSTIIKKPTSTGSTGVISAKHNNFIGHKTTKDSLQKFDHKIVIIGDSHARGCANNVKSNLSDNFRTEGIVKPGAVMNTLMTSGIGVIKELTNKDIIVLWVEPMISVVTIHQRG